jgi:hypothetical protein
MQYRDIELGKAYAYQGSVVVVAGTRVTVNPPAQEEAWVAIRLSSGKHIEVKPHELQPLPEDVNAWNATMERPIGFRRLPT